MINLLPPEEKRQLRAARTNTLLVRYNVAVLSVVVFLGLAVGVTYFYLNATKTSAEQIISENQSKVTSFSQVESEARIFRSNLVTAKQILDNDVAYSKVILAIASVMPSGTVLDKLGLDSSTFGTPTTLTAKAKSYEDAIRLKEAFQSSSVFSDVHFDSITGSTTQSDPYPFSVNLGVTIKKDAAK